MKMLLVNNFYRIADTNMIASKVKVKTYCRKLVKNAIRMSTVVAMLKTLFSVDDNLNSITQK